MRVAVFDYRQPSAKNASSCNVMASANVVCLKKRRKNVRKRKLLLLSLKFAVMANEQRKRTCQGWKKPRFFKKFF